MLKNYQNKSNQWIFTIGGFAILTLLLFTRLAYSQTSVVEHKSVVLQGAIQLQPTKALPGEQAGKIQPGTPIKIIVTVENTGQQASPIGQLFVRYAFANPLDNETNSVIFETEKKSLPIIEPGKKVEVAFDTPHQIPSLLDFVRDDWSIREYQAIAVVNQEDYMIGTLAITFSAYYYPGIKKEFPTQLTLPKNH